MCSSLSVYVDPRLQDLCKRAMPEIDFVKHMLDFLKREENYVPDFVVRMMATIPFQTTDDIDSVINVLIENKNADSAVVIAEARQHPQKALKIIDEKINDKISIITTYYIPYKEHLENLKKCDILLYLSLIHI